MFRAHVATNTADTEQWFFVRERRRVDLLKTEAVQVEHVFRMHTQQEELFILTQIRLIWWRR